MGADNRSPFLRVYTDGASRNGRPRNPAFLRMRTLFRAVLFGHASSEIRDCIHPKQRLVNGKGGPGTLGRSNDHQLHVA